MTAKRANFLRCIDKCLRAYLYVKILEVKLMETLELHGMEKDSYFHQNIDPKHTASKIVNQFSNSGLTVFRMTITSP